ncbi:MAG TPA: hypothetical protein VF426_00885 [Marmoricola sp.]
MDTYAEHARSILACASEIEISVDGEPLVYDDPIGLQDWSGIPTFVCRPDSALALASHDEREAWLTVTSPLSCDESLLLAGRLRHATTDLCDCCDAERAMVVIELDHVLLMRPRECTPITVDSFCDPSLQLNRGYLRRTELHINGAHDDHLRVAIARLIDQPLRTICGARVADLGPTGVGLQWIDEDGAHSAELRFDRAARDADELGRFLRHALHPELC